MKILLCFLFLFPVFAQDVVPEAKPFSRILITSEINLLGFEWKDLGLEKETQFTAPLMRNWEKWLKENLPKTVGEAKICETECLAYLSQWEEKLPEAISASVDPLYKDVLWLKISMNIRRIVQNNVQKYIWEGRVLLLDGNTKKGLAHVSLPREEKEWLNTPQPDVNKSLVSRVYKTPLGAFPGLNQKIEMALPLNRVIKLVITGQRNLGDVTKLVEVLQSRGTSLGLQMEMGEFSPKEAVMRGYYRGEEKSFTDLLSQVKELKSSHNYSLVNEVTGDTHVIRMVKE